MHGHAAIGANEPLGLRIVVLVPFGTNGSVSAAAEMARRLEDSPGVSAADVVILPGPETTSSDPFRLRDRLSNLDADVFVLVAPRRWGPYRSVPAPAINGRAVALVQADKPCDLPVPSLAGTAGAPWVIAAMAKDMFLGPAGLWVETLDRAGRYVMDLRADRTRREDLITALKAGPSVVLYAGHGRTRGWGGYQGVRWDHIAPDPDGGHRPAGLVIAFACDTLKRVRSGVPFGSHLVEGGAARAYLGAARVIRSADAEELGKVVVDLLAEGASPTVAHLVTAIERGVRGQPGASRAWNQFRLVGDPSTSVTQTVPVLERPSGRALR
ncbi:C25 family cysteine peptidase [Kocuria nitroreducens]|uniref:C25 family cysteine peptidase n=1 Tax=Kocuria nitroreducens TaxID=3058914 RepID=UPI0036D93B63